MEEPAEKSAILPNTAPLRTSVETDADAFDRLGPEWDALLDRSDQCSYFLRPDWNRLWWKHHAPHGARLYLITCRNARGELVGLAPLYWRQQRRCGLPLVRELLFLGMGIELKTSEYMDVIARRGQEPEVAAALVERLRRNRDWDRIWLWQVPGTSRVFPHYAKLMQSWGSASTCDRAPYIDTTTSWQDYRARLGRSMRRNVDYYARRLFKRHVCEFARVRDPEHLDAAMEALIRLHQARWQSQGERGVFADPGVAELLHEAARDSLAHGRLRLWTLRIDGTVEAALIGFLDNGVLHYFQKGFNPAYAHEDIGTAILGLCIRDCFDDPAVRAFDFMGGGAAYKDRWAPLARETVAHQAARRNARTFADMTWATGMALLAKAYRAVTPAELRIARAAWLRRRRQRGGAVTLSPLTVPMALRDTGGSPPQAPG